MTGHSLGGGIALVVGALTDRLAVALQPPGGNIGFGRGGFGRGNLQKCSFFERKNHGVTPRTHLFFGFRMWVKIGEAFGIFRFHTHPNDEKNTGDGQCMEGESKCHVFFPYMNLLNSIAGF